MIITLLAILSNEMLVSIIVKSFWPYKICKTTNNTIYNKLNVFAHSNKFNRRYKIIFKMKKIMCKKVSVRTHKKICSNCKKKLKNMISLNKIMINLLKLKNFINTFLKKIQINPTR